MRVTRAMWDFRTRLGLHISFCHVPGHQNILPDALSRRHMSPHSLEISDRMASDMGLKFIDPVMDPFRSLNFDNL